MIDALAPARRCHQSIPAGASLSDISDCANWRAALINLCDAIVA
jgi:hypothetical protein